MNLPVLVPGPKPVATLLKPPLRTRLSLWWHRQSCAYCRSGVLRCWRVR